MFSKTIVAVPVLFAALLSNAADFIPSARTGSAIQQAIDAANAAGGGRVVLEKGTYPSGTIYLKSHVELHVPEGATILGNDTPDGYDDVDDPRIGLRPEKSTKVFIACLDAEDVAITGSGTIDGQGVKFYDTVNMNGPFFKKPPHPRPRMVEFFNCRNVRFEDVTFKDSPGWTCWIRKCENFTAERVKIRGDQRMINNDGFHIDCCRHAHIRHCDVRSGDDCVIMRAMRGPGDMDEYVCEDMLVEDCTLDSACQCIRLTCPSDGTIRHGVFRNLKMRGRNGVLSGHPRRYLRAGESGSCKMEDILVENCDIDVRGSAILFNVEQGVVLREFGNVTFRDIRLKSSRALQFQGTGDTVLRNIRLENVSGTVDAKKPIEMECVENIVFDRFAVTSGFGEKSARPKTGNLSWGCGSSKQCRLGARIVPIDPLLDFVDAREGKMTFFWNGEPAAPGGKLSASVDGRPPVCAILGADRRATVRLGELTKGEHRVKVSLDMGDARIAENSYVITAIAPTRPVAGRKLNNFVVEILDAPLADGEFTFDNPRKGWVFIGFDRSSQTACAMLDGGEEPVIAFRQGEPSETMRWLDEGKHSLVVKGTSGGGRLSVRLVKPLKITARTFANEKTALSLGLKGYGWDFFRRWQIASFNSFTMGGNWRLRSAVDRMAWGNAELLKRGRLPMAAADVRPGELEFRADPVKMRAKFALAPAYLDGLALEMDENKINASAAEMDAYAEAVWELAADRSPRAMFADICDVPNQSLTNLTAQVSAIAAGLNTGRGYGMLVPEIYLGAKQTEEERDAQEEKALAFVESLRAAIPSAPSHTIHLMSGWLTIGSWSSYSSCEVDIKALYDHYIRRLATDPAFHDVGGVGMSTLACDEEVARWTARLVHHYCIEGRTDSLADRFGYKYRPEIVKDGDFLEGFACWTAHPATEGSLRHERRHGYGGKKGQCRKGRNKMILGECFALFTRSATAPNRLVQHVSGLTPGKCYTLTYCTADYDDVCEPGKHSTDGRLTVNLDAAEIVPELSFEWEVPDTSQIKKKDMPPHCITVTYRTVFRATKTDGDLEFSDWIDASSPGGDQGRRRLLNYVSIKPYYVENDDELSQLKSIGKEGKVKR